MISGKDEKGRKWYYMGRRTQAQRVECSKIETAKQQKTVEDKQEKIEMILDMQDDSWMHLKDLMSGSSSSADGSGASSSAPAREMASDEMMMKVQQAFDAVNVSMNNMRCLAMKLRGKIDVAIVQSALEKCKIAQSCLDQLEEKLLTPRDTIYQDATKLMLVDIAKKYQEIRMKEMEMKALDKSFNNKTSGSAIALC